jgi:putative ATP-grasp target RiPP
MWREQDRFPVSALDPAENRPAATTSRPFGLRFVDYSPGRPRFTRPEVKLCPQAQIGLVDGVPASEALPTAATMTSYESDGKDVLTVDWMTDDK